ncbi:hypothetical protein DW829_03510 [Phocaeicola vulgatus]|jgi:hypothetical protein|nr:hypothetical protein DW829_03510 [Phocaeicola vulgatus]
MDLNNIVGFKAVDKNGNERQVTVDEMTELVSARIVSAASEISTFAAAAAAGTDEFEDQLPQSDTFSWLRTLDGSKNPTLTSSTAAAKVLGELIPLATNKSNGLMGAIDKCSIPFPLLSGGSYYVHVPMEGLPFLLQISAPSVAPGLFCCCKTSSSFTINRLFKSADIEGGLVFTYKESMLYVKRSGVYFNIIPLHSGYIFKQGTGDIPNDAIELTIQ